MNIDLILSFIKLMVVSAAIGVGLAFFVWCLCRSLYVGVGMVLLLFLVDTGAVGLPVFSVGFSAYPQDVVFLLIGLAGMLRVASEPRYSTTLWIWLFVGAVLMASFVPGVLQFGTTAGVEFRQYYYFWGGALYFATFTIADRQLTHIVNMWGAAAAATVLIVIYRWFVYFAGGDTSGWTGVAETSTLRVVTADQTLLIAQAFIMVIYLRLCSTKTFWMAMLPFLAIAVLVLQHRTVWVVTLTCLFAIFYLERQERSRLLGNFGILILLVLVVTIPLLVTGKSLDVVSQSLQNSVSEAQGENSTLTWRVQSWRALLEKWAASGPWQYFFGSPFGSGVARYIPGVAQEITVAPHSYYVATLLRIGLIGIIALFAVYVRALVALYRSRHRSSEFPRRGLLVLLLAQLVYFITYSPDYTQGILLGVVLALVGRDELAVKGQQRPASPAALQNTTR